MAYRVYDNGMTADYAGSCCNMKRGLGWDNSRFDTLMEAVEYAIKYLGPQYNAGMEKNPFTARILMEGYKYSSNGDTIQIKEVS